MFNGAKAMDKASAEGDMEEDREIAGGSGEIVARAGGQIIPVIRGSPSHRLRSLIFSLSLSLSFSTSCLLALPSSFPRSRSDDADERVYIMAQRFAQVKKEKRSLFGELSEERPRQETE